jgi:hypothetical protein
MPFILAFQVIEQHQNHGSAVRNTAAVWYSKQKQKVRPRHPRMQLTATHTVLYFQIVVIIDTRMTYN